MAELYEPFSVEFINWLFKHLHKVYKDKCSKEFIDQVLEPECVKKLYSDMFQSSGSKTDGLLFETAVIASEIDDGIPFEEGLKSLERRLKSGSSRSELNVDRNEKKIAMALYDFSGGSKNQISFRKEDLFLVEQSSGKWLYAEKGEERLGKERGWVPHNYILIFERVLSEKLANIDGKSDYASRIQNFSNFLKYYSELLRVFSKS